MFLRTRTVYKMRRMSWLLWFQDLLKSSESTVWETAVQAVFFARKWKTDVKHDKRKFSVPVQKYPKSFLRAGNCFRSLPQVRMSPAALSGHFFKQVLQGLQNTLWKFERRRKFACAFYDAQWAAGFETVSDFVIFLRKVIFKKKNNHLKEMLRNGWVTIL